jgi:hypothetical protein
MFFGLFVEGKQRFACKMVEIEVGWLKNSGPFVTDPSGQP